MGFSEAIRFRNKRTYIHDNHTYQNKTIISPHPVNLKDGLCDMTKREAQQI